MKTSEEQKVAEVHALKYAKAKEVKELYESPKGDQVREYVASAVVAPMMEAAQRLFRPAEERDISLVRKVESCTLAHAVAIRGTETRTVSAQKLDYKAAGLEIFEHRLGLEISYTGTNTKRYSLIVPWSNVVEFRYSE